MIWKIYQKFVESTKAFEVEKRTFMQSVKEYHVLNSSTCTAVLVLLFLSFRNTAYGSRCKQNTTVN